MFLDSPQNPKIQRWSELKTKKGRQAQGAFLVEGMRLVEELLACALDVEAVLWDTATDALPQSLIDAVQARGLDLVEASPRAFLQVSDTVTPQGVLAVAKLPAPVRAPETVRFGLVLDAVRDPGNVGTLIRSADAFAVDVVYCGAGSADPFSPKVVRSSMGGTFRVALQSGGVEGLVESWLTAHPEGRVVLGDANATTTSDQFDFRPPLLLVVGGEAEGASPQVRRLATDSVRIPMPGAADSLNAGVAGSILLYAASCQLTGGS